MRITGGTLSGRITQCPAGIIRPAMDRMRESVFAALKDLSGKSFLDLFSGSATIALEAVSRGASRVELCEKDKQKVKTILSNVAMAEEVGVKIKCHFMPVEYFVKRCKSSFDYIFLDPPFAYRFHEQLAREIAIRGLVKKGGTILVHRPEESGMKECIYLDGENSIEDSVLRLTDRRVYGRSIVDFYTLTIDKPLETKDTP